MITPLHSSLGDRARPCVLKKKNLKLLCIKGHTCILFVETKIKAFQIAIWQYLLMILNYLYPLTQISRKKMGTSYMHMIKLGTVHPNSVTPTAA